MKDSVDELNSATAVVFPLRVSHHSRGLQGAAWCEMILGWLKRVTYNSDCHTPRRAWLVLHVIISLRRLETTE